MLGQEKTADKSNEITAIPKLLEVLSLKGCLVTIDAMGCQQAIAQTILTKGADYVLALKDNQGDFHQDVLDFFHTGFDKQFAGIVHDHHTIDDKVHGRLEHRACWVVNPNEYAHCFSKLEKWPEIKAIVMVKTTRTLPDKITTDTRFYISSASLSAKTMLATVRKHWQIENALHWTLDMTFREDESRIRKGASPENFAIMRHIALNLVKKCTCIKASVKHKRAMAALSDDFRAKLIRQLIRGN